ncbi:MAG: superoxide dismutase [Rhodovibrionaceae bacterium]|nr:superoxide dismutase [Rhodovibrionaceae bacterium]
MAFELPSLPFAEDALEPHMSAKTLSFHHGKHHKAYVDKTNDLVKDTDLEGKSLEEVISAAASDSSKQGLFNQSAQIWNHSFFWNCLSPDGGGQPDGDVAKAIDDAFGSYDKFAEEFKAKAVAQFGSGWAWLVKKNGGAVEIVTTANADTPLVHDGMTALLTCDVWEHAYYLDFQNRRPDFVQSFLDNLANWDFVNKNYSEG